MNRPQKIIDAEHALIGELLTVVFGFVACARDVSSITVTKRSSWNPDAHIEITVTAKQVFEAMDAIDSFRKLMKLKTEAGVIA